MATAETPNNNNSSSSSVVIPEKKRITKTAENQAVLKRLQGELMTLMMKGDEGISAFPEEENIMWWKGTIRGSRETAYEGMEYRLCLSFTNDYPFKPPKVVFLTPCFHPNVDTSGNICLDILQDQWSSAYDIRTILLSIQSLLGEPNTSSPLNAQAATLWEKNQQEYRRMVKKYSNSTAKTQEECCSSWVSKS